MVLSSQNEMKNLDIKIFNIQGKLIRSQNLEFKKEVPIDVSDCSSGIYFLNVKDQSGKEGIKKFIKK